MRANLAVLFVFITVTINSMGIGLIMPVMPSLIQEVEGGNLAQAAMWGGVLATSFAVMQFLFGPLLGRLSDAYGRRPVLLVSLTITALDYVVMAMAGSIWLLLAGRLVGGITAATQSTAMAYMADISTGEEKAKRFGLVGAAFGAGFVLGPMIGGLLAELGTRAPFVAAAVLTAVNAVFGALVLPETLKPENRRRFSFQGVNPFSAFMAIGQSRLLRNLAGVYLLYNMATYVYPAIWSYFTQERFGWTAGMIGLSLATYGSCMAIAQGALITPIIKRLGERKTVIFGFGIEVFSLVLLGFITSGWVALAFIPIMALGAVGTPALQGMMSRAVADNMQGELQGILSSVMSLAMIAAPLVMTQTFAAFSDPNEGLYLPGMPFLVAAVMMVGAYITFVKTLPSKGGTYTPEQV